MKMRQNKGITLVALIITIITMLILVAVTIQVVINSGLFETASNAGKNYSAVAKKESNMSKINIAGAEYNSIDEYIKITEEKDDNEEVVRKIVPIRTAADLAKIGTGETVTIDGKDYVYALDGHYKLEQDIDLNNTEWMPIGTATGEFQDPWNGTINTDSGFKGILDGNGKKIKNLKITNNTNNFIGLFGAMNTDSAIKNLTIENCNINTPTSNYVGGIVGFNFWGKITNVTITGNISITGNDYVGGMAGIQRGHWRNDTEYQEELGRGLLYECTINAGTITGHNNVAGIAGYGIDNNVTMCSNKAQIVGNDNVSGILAGNVATQFNNCKNEGEISGANNIGGITANTYYSEVQNCNNIGKVTGTNDNIGGIVGVNSFGNILNCTSQADITGTNNVGGVVGNNSYATVSSCTSSGSVTGTGSNINDIVGYSGAESIIE